MPKPTVLYLRDLTGPRRLSVRAERLPEGQTHLSLGNLDVNTARVLSAAEARELGEWLTAGLPAGERETSA